MNDKVILTQIPIDELKATLQTCIREELAASRLLESNRAKPKDPELLTIKEISELFRVSKVTIHSWIKKGIIKRIKKSSRTYFLKSEVMQSIQLDESGKNRGSK